MNILLLTQFFSTTRGGGEYLFSIIAKGLIENNHKVFIITNRISDETYEEHVNLKLVFVPPTLEYKGGLPPSFGDNLNYMKNAILSGLKIINKYDIDLVHSNNFSPAIVGATLSFLKSKPHVTSIWDIFSLCGKDYWQRWANQTGVSSIYSFLGPRFEKLVLKLPHNAIHTISEATKDDLIKFGASKPIHVIPPSIKEATKISITTKPFQFIYVGRLVFYKNLEVVIKAIGIVRKEFPNVKLIIAGGGPHKKSLKELIRNLDLEINIEFAGYVDTKEKTRLIAQSNGFLFPSLCEGFGLVILEAFEQSKPVLVSNIRPMSDIVINGECGYVLNPHDEKEWADHISKMIRNPEKSSEMGMTGLRMLNTEFNQKRMYKKIMQMYDELKAY